MTDQDRPHLQRRQWSMWDRFLDSGIGWVQCEIDDEPQTCFLCTEQRSAGKEFPVGDSHATNSEHQSEFICEGCWAKLTIKLLQMPDPGPDKPINLGDAFR